MLCHALLSTIIIPILIRENYFKLIIELFFCLEIVNLVNLFNNHLFYVSYVCFYVKV